MPPIKKVTVTYIDGTEDTFEGTGFISEPRSNSYHDPSGTRPYVVGRTISINEHLENPESKEAKKKRKYQE